MFFRQFASVAGCVRSFINLAKIQFSARTTNKIGLNMYSTDPEHDTGKPAGKNLMSILCQVVTKIFYQSFVKGMWIF